jgi:2-hydroxychromene-2-carboxylate isomerase
MQMQQPQRFDDFVSAIFKSMWAEGRNLGDPAIVGEVLVQASFDAQSVLALTTDPAIKEALKANTEEAVRRGAFGAPTMFVGNQMFFGQDRLDFVREALAES